MGAPGDDTVFEQAFDLVYAELAGDRPPRHGCLAACIKARDGEMGVARKGLRFLFCNYPVSWPRCSAAPHDPGEMTKRFLHRVTMTYYARRALRDLLSETDRAPYWMLVAIDDGRTPPECLRAANVVRRFEDPFWRQHPIPCAHPECRCRIRNFTAAEVARRGVPLAQ